MDQVDCIRLMTLQGFRGSMVAREKMSRIIINIMYNETYSTCTDLLP